MLEFLKTSILESYTFSYYTFMDLPGDVICNIAIYADDITLYSNCDQASESVANN